MEAILFFCGWHLIFGGLVGGLSIWMYRNRPWTWQIVRDQDGNNQVMKPGGNARAYQYDDDDVFSRVPR